MVENVIERKIFSLADVTKSISKTIAERYKSSYWIKAEMNKLNFYSHSGHCYPDLVEKKNGKIIAEMRGTLWSDDYRRIKNSFLKILKEPLKDGINILFCANINYDPVYGMSLRILDIDPSFTLGELEREKLETIDRLQKEDLFTTGKRHVLPLLPKRIAIISVDTSKGYADFIKMIDNNPWGYHFFCMLFPAILQGEKAVDSILYQMARIRKVYHHFDVMVIVRGGGGDVGLSCYNNYDLAKEIATFPIPVLTGIGHATNETVAEMIAFKNAITPTALADIFIQHLHDFVRTVDRGREVIVNMATRKIESERARISDSCRLIKSTVSSVILNHRYPLDQKGQMIRSVSRAVFAEKNALVNTFEQKITAMDPINVIRRGYTMTLIEGKLLQDISQVKKGSILKTILAKGSTTSIVEEIDPTV